MKSFRPSTVAQTALVALALMSGPALAEPVTITFLHTNDVYEIAPKGGKGGFAEARDLARGGAGGGGA